MKGETWHEQSIVVRTVTNLGDEPSCDLLYVPAEMTDHFLAHRNTLETLPILTVGEDARFSDRRRHDLICSCRTIASDFPSTCARGPGRADNQLAVAQARARADSEWRRPVTRNTKTQSLRRKLTLVALVTIVAVQVCAAIVLIGLDRTRAQAKSHRQPADPVPYRRRQSGGSALVRRSRRGAGDVAIAASQRRV